ncbi:MAG: hypothetical protein OSJ27_06690 [Candidatus Gastranaerophilales bacterium]|nr:hypothetical protein [Candidatus Gastranaerophilales bacterium]
MIKSFRLKRLLLPFKSSKFSAFSLVEMLMALLVASLLLAALAPVMTKKINEKVNFEGLVPNPTRKKIVYLTEPGVGEWIVPNGIRSYKVTTVGAGGGGGAGSSYGCVVFTTTATPTGSLLGDDAKYCEHVRTDSSTNFTIPEGINEIYVSMVSGAGGGGAGSAKIDQDGWSSYGNHTWTVPVHLKGDRIYMRMLGGGGGGGGSDQGGGGGGASGGFWEGNYDIPLNKDKIEVVIGEGGKGGNYWGWPGIGGKGWRDGTNGVTGTSGGGGGGSTSFNNGEITVFGGGGGAGAGVGNNPAGWADVSSVLEGKLISADNALWRTCFNYGGNGRNGGGRGPCTYVDKNTGNSVVIGGASGGIGGEGGGLQGGLNGQDGTVGTDGKAYGDARGGKGGAAGAGPGTGGRGQDFFACANDSSTTTVCDVSSNIGGGGAGGGGGGSAWDNASSAPTGCKMPHVHQGAGNIPKSGIGAGGAGASCGWNAGGAQTGGEGGDGTIALYTPTPMFGGTGGTAGAVVPRSKIALNNVLKSGNVITVTLGKGGKGGDRVILNNLNFTAMDRAGNINTSSSLANAAGQPGTATTIMFSGTTIATTGTGSCGGGYTTNGNANISCANGVDCGTRRTDGRCITAIRGWHGNQSGACTNGKWDGDGTFLGSATQGGNSTILEWDGFGIFGDTNTGFCGPEGGSLIPGNFSARNGLNGTVGMGGSGSYYGGYGGKGGDGYVKIEWGIPRNIDHSDAIRYSGGGGSAGETVTKRITVSAVTNKIKYRIGEGGTGGSYNKDNNTMQDGSNGGDTSFGIDGNYGFETIKSKGGTGGKSVHITSTYDSNFIITKLTGAHGSGGIAQCFTSSNCTEAIMNTMNGKEGKNNKGGAGGTSSTGVGGNGGLGTNINGFDALEFDGTKGGGAGGGGGISANNNYGKGGKGANGYIKIEYDD